MAAPIQKMARLAFHLFSRKQNDVTFLEGLKSLQVMLNNITSKDLNFDVDSLKSPYPAEGAPVAYLPIWEDNVISIGVFVVRPHGRLPLHDHPGMHGLIRVIHGSLSLKSFSETQAPSASKLTKTPVKAAKRLGERVVTPADECCILTPTEGNFHEIRPVSETSAFLDVLAPPYGCASDCNYYTEIPVPGNERNGLTYLSKIAPPADYWCETFDYSGPVIDKSQFQP